MSGIGQLLKSFWADTCPPCTGRNLALQGGNACLQGPQLSPALRLKSLQGIETMARALLCAAMQESKAEVMPKAMIPTS